MPALVIAVAAPIGGGKSALVNALAQALGNAVTLRFDDYEMATGQSVEQLALWLAEGADFDRLQAPGLAEDLIALREGRGIGSRSTGRQGPAVTAAGMREVGTVVFEMPLGRAWSQTAPLIDVLVWVDAPLDIALARRLREVTAGILHREPADLRPGLVWMHDYLGHYTGTLHAVLSAQRQAVRPQADLAVGGQGDVAAMTAQVLQFLEARGG